MKIFLFFALFLLFIISGCDQNNDQTIRFGSGASDQSNDSDERKTKTIKKEAKDKRLGFSLTFRDESQVGQEAYTFVLPKDKPLTPKISVRNKHPQKLTYRLYFILDYKQIHVNYKGENKKYIDLNVEGNSQLDVEQVKVNQLSKGVHQLMVMIFRAPQQHVKEDKFIPGEKIAGVRRIALFVGTKNKIKEPSVDFREIKSKNTKKTGMFSYISHQSFATVRDAVGIIENHKKPLWFTFNVIEDHTSFFLGALIGNDFIPLKKPYVKVKHKGLASVPLKLDLTKYQQKKNVLLFAVPNPYIIKQKTDGTVDKNIHSFWVFPSNIATIEP